MLRETIHITSEYLSQEAKATLMGSKVEALDAENSKLRKDLIATMDKANTTKEKAKVLANDLRVERQLTLKKDEQLQAAKEKVKTIEAFQQTKEYKTVLFSWYYKSCELFRRYLIKHLTSMDLGGLDLKEVDKEMEADEASQSFIVAPKWDALEPAPVGGDEASA